MSTLTPNIDESAGSASDGRSLSGSGELSMSDILIAVMERKRTIARVTVGTMLVALIGALLLPNRYTATTTVLPPQQSQSMAAMLAAQLGSLGPLAAAAGKDLGLKSPNDIYIGMLKSETIQNAQIERFDLRRVYRRRRISDARVDLQSASKFVSTKEGFIAVSVEDRDPRRAAAMANNYIEEMRKLAEHIAVTEAGQRRMFFEEQLRQIQKNLNAAEQAFKDVQQKTGVIQLDGQSKAIIEADVQLRSEVASKEVQLQALRSFATDSNPEVSIVNQELLGLRAQLEKIERQQTSASGAVQVPVGAMPEAALEYARRLREVKYNEGLFEFVSKQYEAAKMDEARQGTVIQVVDPATVPDKKSFPPRAGLVLVITLFGFFLSVVWAILNSAIAKQPERLRQLRMLKSLMSWHQAASLAK